MSREPKNAVRLIDGAVIEAICQGQQTPENIKSVVDKATILIEGLQKQGQPILYLVQIRNIGSVSVESRRFAAASLRNTPYDKVAIYGASNLLRRLIELIVRAVGKQKHIQIFADRQTALDWLHRSVVEQQVVKKHGPETVYRAYVARRLEQLNDLISLAVIGEYSKDIPIPKDEDEFTDTFVGIRVLIETLEEKAMKIRTLAASQLPESPERSAPRSKKELS